VAVCVVKKEGIGFFSSKFTWYKIGEAGFGRGGLWLYNTITDNKTNDRMICSF
jgi:hypothetical protein